MKRLAFLLSLAAAPAMAHPSLLPHTHENGAISMLPDLGTLVVATIFLFAGALVAYARVRKD